MKTRVFLFTLFCLIGGIAKSATFTWANTNGGDWNIATNWTPQQVPASGDNVIITNTGTFTVTNTSGATVGNFSLGGSNGVQTLFISTLTVTNLGIINSNGVLTWNSGMINGSLTVAPGGVLNITNNTTYSIFGTLTNNGTVNWSAGSLYGYGPPGPTGLIYNAGLWNAQFDGTLTLASGTPYFINTGTFRKSGGTGSTSIGWNFTSTGSFDVRTGSLASSTWVSNSILNGVYTGAISLADTNATMLVASNAVVNWVSGGIGGALTIAQGGVLNITNNTTYTFLGTMTNNGTVNWSAGSLYGYGPPNNIGLIYNAGLWNAQFDGTLTLGSGTPYFINTGIFRKSGGTGNTSIGWNFTTTGSFDVQTGSLATSTWVGTNNVNGNYSGLINPNSNAVVNILTSLPLNWTGGMVAAGGAVNITSNAVVNWAVGTINGSLTVAAGAVLNITNNTTYSIFGAMTNNGTVNWSAGSLYGYGPPGPTGLIYNAGLWNAQFDGSFTPASGTPYFINTGIFRKSGSTGTTSIGWNFTSTGSFDVQSGALASSTWVSNSILNGVYTGGITLTDTNATMLVASNAVLNWNNGTINGAMTVAMGGVLNITNNTTYAFFGRMTNNGTVNWSAGSLYGYGPPSTIGLIYNAGLWNAQFDGTFTPASGTPYFINVGTFKKSGGTGTTSLGWNLTSTGIFAVQTGSLASSTWVSNSILNGVYTGGINLMDTNATMLVASNAVVNWNNGGISGALTVAPGAVWNITNNTTYSFLGFFTNNGTVNWSAGSLYGYGPPSSIGLVYNAGLWNAQFDGTLTPASGTPAFINAGTFRKSSGGGGTTAIGWSFTNSVGTLDSQTNNLSLTGSYNLSGGTLNTGINSRTNNGTITLPGAAVLAGTVSANLNNGYIPIGGNAFTNILYGSFTGLFTNTVLPFADAWSTNYHATFFVLNVLNARPVIVAPTTNLFVVNELTTLNVTNTATDADIPAQGLAYSLVAGINGMAVNPATGVLTWTPQQTNSPATNLVAVAVTDNGTPPLSATNSYTVIVKEINVAPSLAVIATQIVNELTLLTVTNSATNSNIHSIITGYTLVNPPANMAISASGIITWTPAQTQSPATNVITTIVTNSNPYDLVNPQLTSTNQFIVIVKEINVAPSLPVIAPQVVNELNLLTITNSATNFNIHSTITGYGLVNPPANMVISASGIITWTPAQTQSPATNLITTIVTNSNPYDLVNPMLTATNQFTVIVKEINVAPSLAVISTQIVNELTLLTVTNSATNSNIHSIITGYTLVSPPSNMVVSASGIITWTPAQAQSPGTNLITTIVTNSNPYDLVNPILTATNQFTVIVREVNVAPTLPAATTNILNELTLLTLTNAAAEANIHSAIGYLLVGAPAGMSIGTNGVVTWTPSQLQSPGTNVVTTIVTNSNPYDLLAPHLSATNTFTVIVKEVNVAPVLPNIATQTVTVSTLLTVANTAVETNIHSALGYLLVSPPAGASISASGIITWTPSDAQKDTTNTITTIVTNSNPYDVVNPHLSATNSFVVIVKPVLILTGAAWIAGNQFQFTLNDTVPGVAYTIDYSTNLLSWISVLTFDGVGGPVTIIDPNAGAYGRRFYRVKHTP